MTTMTASSRVRGQRSNRIRNKVTAKAKQPTVPVNLASDLAQLAAIINSSEDAIISLDLRGTILTWNPAAERMFGYHRSEIAGSSITRLIPADRISEEKEIVKRIRRGERMKHYETVRLRKDGGPIDVSLTVSPIRDSRERIVGASTVARDIGEQKHSEAALRESEQRMRAVVETAVDAIITINDRGIIDSVNPATERLFGYQRSELLGRNVNLLMPQPYLGEHKGYIENYLRSGMRRIIGIGREVVAMRKDGTTFPVNLSVSEVRLGDRLLFTGILHNLSGRRELEKQVLEASVNEQRRIGQDLHDGLCQELIGIGLAAEVLANQLEAKSLPEAQAARKLGHSMRQVAAQAREMARGLNPVSLHAGGLHTALQELAAKVSHSFGIRCTFRFDGSSDVDDDAVATHLFRIAQEAITNAIRHGKATRIELSLKADRRRIALLIKDNGVGMPAKQARMHASGGTAKNNRAAQGLQGMGLQTMLFRARLIGGSCEIESRLHGGTVVTCAVHHPRIHKPGHSRVEKQLITSENSRPAKPSLSR